MHSVCLKASIDLLSAVTVNQLGKIIVSSRVQSDRKVSSRVASDDDDDSNASDPDFEDSDIEDDDQVASSGSKRLRAHGNANNKAPRVCQYGTSCYRRNPAHFQEFAHPWLSKDDTSVDKHDKAATSSRRQPSVNSTGRPARDVSGSPRGSPTPPLQTSSRPHVKTSTYITPTGQIGASTRSPLNTSRSRSNSVDDPSRSIAKTETQNKDDQSRNQSSRTASGSPSRSNSGDDAGHPTHDTETDKLNNGLRDQSQEPTLSPRRLPESSIAEQEKSEMANIVLQSLPKASDDKPTNQHRAFLAFPSISTEEGAVNLGHAVTAVSAIIRQTLAQNGWSDVRFNLIDTNQVTVESFRKELSAVPGFSAVVGDISHLHTRHGLEADTIVAETSWRWRQCMSDSDLCVRVC
ncbi:hypothetical protein DFS34DRAFT_364101 [Phlyctochytrium arcticum]|nr:hypothetical protein DFS34DRAFT_364101 [Phlyctochytrium arcticum]